MPIKRYTNPNKPGDFMEVAYMGTGIDILFEPAEIASNAKKVSIYLNGIKQVKFWKHPFQWIYWWHVKKFRREQWN